MATKYERAVEEDLNLGHGSVSVTMPGGGSATGSKIGIHTFVQVFNAQDFGALGNGATIDKTAIQNAITALAAAGGGIVYLPPGIYPLGDATLDSGAGVVLEGAGQGLTIIKSTSSTRKMIHIVHSDVGVRRLTLQGTGATGGDAPGITADTSAARVKIEDVEIVDINGIGINTAITSSTIRQCHIHDCDGNGINLSGGSAYNEIVGNTIHDNAFAGIGCNGSYNNIHDNHIYSNGGGVVDVNDWSGINITYAAGSTYFADGNIVHNNILHDNASSGITVAGSSQAAGSDPYHPYGNVITGNVCFGHTSTPTAWLQIPAGIAIYHGGENTVVANNFCYHNYHNFAFAGWGGFDGRQLNVIGNSSLSAVNDGFHFADNPWNLPSGAAQQAVLVMNNTDALAGRDGFRFEGSVYVLSNYRVHHNLVRDATTYSYNATSASFFTTYTFSDNLSVSPGTADTHNITVTTSAASTLTGTTLATNIVASSLTSLGTLSALNVGGTALFGAENKQWAFDSGVPYRLAIVKKGGALPALTGCNGQAVVFAMSDNTDLSVAVTGQTLTETARIDASRMTMSLPIKLKAYTVSTLPSGSVGDTAYVTDATAPTYNGALTGGGAVKARVFYNGSAWVSG